MPPNDRSRKSQHQVAACAIRLVRETTVALHELARFDRVMARAFAGDIYQQFHGRDEAIVNDAPPLAKIDMEESGADDFDSEDRSDSEIRSYLEPNEIDQRSLDNRKLKGPLIDEIIVLRLLANDRSLVFSDIRSELKRLRIRITDSTLLSRLSRLRDDGALEPVSVTGMGLYRLSAAGKKIAEAAREKRWPNRAAV